MFTRWVLPLVGLIMLALPACRMWSNPFDAQSFDDVQLTSMSPASEEYWRQERLRLVSDQQDKQIGLADAVRITEVPHNSETTYPVKADGRYEADFRSDLKISFKQEIINQLIAEHQGVSPPSSDKKAQESADSAAKFGVELQRILNEAQAVTARARSGVALSDVEQQDLRTRWTRLENVAGKLRDAAMQVIRERAPQFKFTVDDNDEFTEPGAAKYIDDAEGRLIPDGLLFDGAEMARLLQGQHTQLLDKLKEELKAIKTAGYEVTLEAVLVDEAGKRSFVPVENYSSETRTPQPLKNPLSLELTPEKRKELQDRLAKLGQVAKVINDLRDSESELRKTLKSLGESLAANSEKLKEEVEKLKALLPDSWKEVEFEKVAVLAATHLGQLQVNDISTEDRAKVEQAIAAVRAGSKDADLKVIRDFLQEVLDLAGKFTDTGTLAQQELLALLSGDVKSALQSLVDKARNVPDKVTALTAAVEGVWFLLGGGFVKLREAKQAEADALLASLQINDKSAEKVKEFGTGLAALLELTGALDTLIGVGRSIGEGTRAALELNPAEHDPNLIPRPAADLPPGKIMLNSEAGASDGSVLTLFVTFRRPDGTALGHSKVFDIRVIGMRGEWSASLVFINRVNEPGGTIPETDYEASAALGYTFYLRMRDADFFNALGIGIGGSFIPTNLDDNGGFEPGFAVHAKLFNGAIETGYGRALGVDDGEFWFVGTDLFTLGTQLGGLVESF